VLYLLAGTSPVERRETTATEQREFRKLIERIGQDSGAIEVSGEPPVSSGLPYPRLVDIPGWDVLFDIPLNRYLDSPSVFPSVDFRILWLVGVTSSYSEKRLACIDMRHAQVKGLFIATYEEEYGSIGLTRQVRRAFERFLTRVTDRIAEASRPDVAYEWVKVASCDGELLEKIRNRS